LLQQLNFHPGDEAKFRKAKKKWKRRKNKGASTFRVNTNSGDPAYQRGGKQGLEREEKTDIHCKKKTETEYRVSVCGDSDGEPIKTRVTGDESMTRWPQKTGLGKKGVDRQKPNESVKKKNRGESDKSEWFTKENKEKGGGGGNEAGPGGWPTRK